MKQQTDWWTLGKGLLGFAFGAFATVAALNTAAGHEGEVFNERQRVIDVYESNMGDPQSWLYGVVPKSAPYMWRANEKGDGRMWIRYPLRINGTLYMEHSTNLDGAWFVREDGELNYIPWHHIKDVAVTIDAQI